MERIVYREARLDEYKLIGKVCSDAFMNYPFLTVIKEDLKKPEYFPAFIELLHTLLVKLYIKGEVIAVGLLQQKDFSMVSYLVNGIFKLFRYISPWKLMKYLDLVERSEQHLKKSGNFDWYLMMFAVSPTVQGQGVGSHFLQNGIEPYVKAKGCKRLGLITSTQQNVFFYEKNEFVLLDSMVLDYGKQSVGNWAFLKTLDDNPRLIKKRSSWGSF